MTLPPRYLTPAELARTVVKIGKKPSAPSLRTRAEAPTGSRRALTLLAGCFDGWTEALMLAHGFGPPELAGLVRAGLAISHIDRVRAGAEWLEVRRFQITQAGRQALGKELRVDTPHQAWATRQAATDAVRQLRALRPVRPLSHRQADREIRSGHHVARPAARVRAV